MCILFVYTNPSPQPGGYRLIVASNRDEYYKRPARGAFLCEKTGIIGGRDMEPGREGGMWLGTTVKKQDKIAFAALLNVTGAGKVDGALGRGPIVHDYLCTSSGNSLEYFEDLKSKTFAGFNVVTVEVTKNTCDTYHYTNCPVSETLQYPGRQVLGFGNSNPACPLIKVKNGRNKFEDVIENGNVDKSSEEELVNKLLGMLKSEERHLPDEELEKRAPAAYKQLSQVYVKIQGSYGTRTHSVILVDDDGNLVFTEHTMGGPIVDVDNPKWDVTVIRSRL